MPKQQQKPSVEQFAPDTTSSMRAPKRLTSSASAKIAANKKSIFLALLIIVGIGALAFGLKSYLDLRQAKNELNAIKSDPNAQAKEEARELVEQVGKLVVLPENEEPTVATVTDPAKLADQPFFANAKAGDKVFIYTTSQRAILYRPSENKVIEIAPLNIDDPMGVGQETFKEDLSAQQNANSQTRPNTTTKTTNTNSRPNTNQ